MIAKADYERVPLLTAEIELRIAALISLEVSQSGNNYVSAGHRLAPAVEDLEPAYVFRVRVFTEELP